MQEHMHHKRRLLIALAMTGGIGVGLGPIASPAAAEPRTFELTLLGNIKRTITLDVPAATPLDQVKFPGLKLPVLSIVETTQKGAVPSGGPLLSIKPTAPAQQAPAAPASPAAEAQDQLLDVIKPSKKKKGKPSAGQPVFDSAGRLLSTQLPERERPTKTRLRHSNGVPTLTNPALSLASLGPVPVGVPNFFINKFRIPPFLLSIYQAAGIQYGVRWEVLAAINEIETDYGRNLNVSSAGAMGWMQFIPSSWKSFGVDANGDGKKDPYNPVDAIFAAARYLKAAGADQDLRKAIFAYNHADWYVDSVLMRARLIAGVPGDLVGSLTGLTEGRFPVYARARYADDLSEREAERRFKRGQNAARVVEGSESRRGIEIYSKRGAPVVATNDGVIKKIGYSKRVGRYIVLQDVYGNRYTYAGLGSVVRSYPVPKDEAGDGKVEARAVPATDRAPKAPASAGRQTDSSDKPSRRGGDAGASRPSAAIKERLFANPYRKDARDAGGLEQILNSKGAFKGFATFKNYFSRPFGLDPKDVRLKELRRGSRVISGTILGRVGKPKPSKASHLYFEIRPAGRGAPRIDPKPILDGWKLLEATAIYRANGRNALYDKDGDSFSVGQILLLPTHLLEKRVLSDERIEIYPCGRQDIRGGRINRRVLATLAYLAEVGLRPTVTSLQCGHGFYTSAGGVSHHSSGNAVDIAKINGVPILGHQERGGVTDQSVKRLLYLQGTMRPDQIISLLDMGGPTFAMGDHADHIHVGFRPLFGANRKLGKQALTVLKPGQWSELVDRLGNIENPVVPTKPSKYSIKVKRNRRASRAHRGE